MSKFLYVFVFISTVQNICGTARAHFIDVASYNSLYYDPATGLGLKGELEDSGRLPLSAARISFRGLPCHCESLSCGCCAGLNITAMNFDRRACTNFTFDPNDVAIKMALIMNEREVYSSSLSGRNPPPLCVPFAYFPLVNFCVRFFDISTPGRNIRACIDFETRVIGSPILILHFNCVKLGANGISWTRPEDGSSIFQVKPDGSSSSNTVSQKPEVSQPEPDDYDDVDFETSDLEVYINNTSTLSPEQESLIGTLKLGFAS